MEFQSLRNIETAFRQIRLYILVFALLSAGVSGYALYSSYRFAEKQREKIYGAINAKAMSTRFSLYRYYLGLHYWLRVRCDRLSPKVVYGISMLYLACSLMMLVQVFFPRQEACQLPIPRGHHLDAPLRPSRLDSLGRELSRITHQKIAHYG